MRTKPKFSKPMTLRSPRRSLPLNLAGAGGGKGGSGSARAPYEALDSVRSKAFARIKDLVSEGPIVGPVAEDGSTLPEGQIGRAVLLDETPVQNADGSFNFKNVTINFVPGSADQDYIPGFDSEEAEIAVGVRAKEAGDTVVRSINTPDLDAIRVTVRIPSLIKQDTATGDITGHTVQFAIDVNTNGGGWVEKVNHTVTDKISSPYLISFRINLDGAGPWQVRLRRISWRENTSSVQNETWFDSYTEIIDGKFRHPFCAMFGIQIDAEQFSAIPSVAYRIRGRIIRVPSNYDPIARTYSGVWDGTFKLAWTNNPAWVYYDILTHKRYGMGKWIDETIVDKWALYAIAKVCDTMVSDGKGGQEPLYACNLCIEEAIDAYTALYNLASIFHGLAIWAGGQFSALQDAPRDAVAIFNNANVENGLFEYTGTSKDARHTVANVYWNNPANMYRREPVYVPDHDGLFKYGANPIDVTAYGCTSEAQAIRRGRHVLVTEKTQREATTFVTGLDCAFLRPNMVFKTLDRDRAGKPHYGRVKAASVSQVTMDKAITLEAGKAYEIFCLNPVDGTVMKRPIVNTQQTTTTLDIAAGLPFSAAPLAQSVFIIQSSSLFPEEWECVGVKEEAPGKFRVAGVAYYGNKYQEIQTGIAIEPNPTTELPKVRLVQPPGAITVREESVANPVDFKVFLNLSWPPSEDAYLRAYRLAWRYNNGNWQTLPDFTAPNTRIETMGPGSYQFRLIAVNSLGYESGPVRANYELGTSSPIDNARVTGLEIYGKGNDTTFEGRDCKVVWRTNNVFTHELGAELNGGDDGFQHPLFRDFIVRVYDATTSKLLREESVQETAYTYTFEKNAEDAKIIAQEGGSHDPRRKFRITVQVRDKYNDTSAPTSLTVSNPAPAAPAVSVEPDLAAAVVRMTPSSDLDFVGYVIHASKTENFVPSDANKVYDGPDTLTRIKLEPGVTWFLRAAGFDAFGKTALTFSEQFTVLPKITLDTMPPAVPTNVALTTEVVQNLDGSQSIKMFGTWDANTEEDFDKYLWRVKEVGGSPFSWFYGTNAGIGSTRVEFIVKANVAYEFQVAASDRDANVSAYSASATITSAKDTQPPAAPTWIAGNASFRNVFLSWQNPPDLDFDSVELWENTVNNSATATRIFPASDDQPGLRGTSEVLSLPATGDFTGLTRFYWLKARDTSKNVSGFSTVLAVTMAGVPKPTGLTLATSVEADVDGTQRSYITASWDASTFAEFGGFTIEVSRVAGAGDFYRNTIRTNSVKIPVPGNVAFFVRVRQDDANNGRSAYTDEVTITSAKDTQAPNPPSSVVADAAIRAVIFNWTNDSVNDLSEILVYRALTNSDPGAGATPFRTLGRANSWVDDNLTIGQTYHYFFRAKDTSGNISTAATYVTATPGQLAASDIPDFAITLTKRYNATVALLNDAWTDNSPAAGRIAWNAHQLYYRGAVYAITAGNTNAVAGDSWVYWDAASPTVYQVSATNPVLTDGQFLIATNVGGVHDLAWNAMANAMIGTAYIENLAVTNAKILSLNVDKLRAGTVTAQEIIIAGGTAGIIRSADYAAGSAGWAIWHGGAEFNAVTVRGNIAAGTISIGASANDVFKVDQNGNIWAGNAAFASAPFSVTNAGFLKATNAEIKGNVQARSLEVGQTILLGDATNTTNSILQSYGFAAGTAGWRIRGSGDAEFNNVTIRGAAIVSGNIGSTSVANVEQGAGRANSAINGSYNLVTAFAPGSAAPATGTGLFMGNDKFGFFTAGAWKTYMDNAGRFYLSGSGTHSLAWDGSTLTITGSISVTSTIGTTSASTIETGGARAAAALDGSNNLTTNVSGTVGGTAASTVATGSSRAAGAIDSSLNYTQNVSGSIAGTAASTVKDGAAKANAGLDNAGKLITAVLPGAAVGAAPANAGLFLGSDYLGFYNAGWKTYMDNQGNFYLGGTAGNLVWSASTNALTIQGNSTFKGTVQVGTTTPLTIQQDSTYFSGGSKLTVGGLEIYCPSAGVANLSISNGTFQLRDSSNNISLYSLGAGLSIGGNAWAVTPTHKAVFYNSGQFSFIDNTTRESSIIYGPHSGGGQSGYALTLMHRHNATGKYGMFVGTNWLDSENKIFTAASVDASSGAVYERFSVRGNGDAYFSGYIRFTNGRRVYLSDTVYLYESGGQMMVHDSNGDRVVGAL